MFAVVILLIFRNGNIVISNSLDQKVNKFYSARSKREAELHAMHEDFLLCLKSPTKFNKAWRFQSSRVPETTSPPEKHLAQHICSRQQINFDSRASPNANLPPFPKTKNPATAKNFPLHPSTPPSSNTQQHNSNSEPTNPNVIPIPNPVFAPNLTVLIPHAPLINQPHGFFFKIKLTKYRMSYVPLLFLTKYAQHLS